ncbi:hypothetical protein FSY75_32725 [Streptomyces sp. TR1341]|nr:hypothetical protein [Streptomyces sp. TR1341]
MSHPRRRASSSAGRGSYAGAGRPWPVAQFPAPLRGAEAPEGGPAPSPAAPARPAAPRGPPGPPGAPPGTPGPGGPPPAAAPR